MAKRYGYALKLLSSSTARLYLTGWEAYEYCDPEDPKGSAELLRAAYEAEGAAKEAVWLISKLYRKTPDQVIDDLEKRDELFKGVINRDWFKPAEEAQPQEEEQTDASC